MMPNFNPKQMQQMMRQMGIKSDNIEASRVIIEKKDGGKITIENPTVTVIEMQGQKTFQIAGEIKEEGSDSKGAEKEEEKETEGGITEKDVALVAEQAKVDRETARKALEETNGDIAEAIMKLEK